MSDVTQILSRIDSGDPTASAELLPLVYNELRELAAARLIREKPGQTLQATALVHEAYLRLVAGENQQRWNSRAHFFGAAAEAMRRILVENARRKAGPEAGGRMQRVEISCVEPETERIEVDLLALDEALARLAAKDPRKAELVKLRYFCGLSHQEAAESLGLSRATADRYWAYAKAFLFAALQDEHG